MGESSVPQRSNAVQGTGRDKALHFWADHQPPATRCTFGPTFTFRPGTLTLRNKYEASDTWFDFEKDTVWKTTSAYKPIRDAVPAGPNSLVFGRPSGASAQPARPAFRRKTPDTVSRGVYLGILVV